ncbi:type II pantothenate kinase [Saccharibacillus endophyticus]|uniref:Type II pantothenate kinase n=1 Tax=Saccharibacillus endophyticus TaxID=2060666 RepID=A0ABQ1ZZV9_9BACL|nr:type II pantothenate kinase [Saccharibacillus endophyticus]GGH83517.1 type II pantothenate kinase [Saccharibacillus endophyticus]
MTGYAGIDAGGTLVKIAYLSDGSAADSGGEGLLSASLPILVKFPTERIEAAVEWVRRQVPRDTVVGFTGGQAQRLRALLPEYEASAVDVPEFEATAEGAVRILKAEAEKEEAAAASGRFVLVNVGTGTSLHVIEGGERLRLGGIGLGGGTIVGLTGLLCGVRDYAEIARLAPLGSREAVDLTVGQIYAPAIPPIAGDLTAANFARPVPPATGAEPQDYAAAVIGMVAEIVVTVGVQAAGLQKTNQVVYIGSSYQDNALLRELTLRFTEMLGATAKIPKQGPYSGAIGALHLAKR